MFNINVKNAKFLIVDDELTNVIVLERMLEEWGCYQVQSTTDPHQAVELFTEFQPDIVLLDLMMPKLNGFEVMQLLLPLIPDTDFLPILVLTADTTMPTKHKSLAVGAHDFLSKPFDMVELSLRISNLIHTRFLHRQLRDQNQILDQKVRKRTRELAQAETDTLECLALAGEYRDDDTGQHTRRVGLLSGRLATALGLDEKQATLLGRAAPLHDAGKIGIPDHILLKPGKLTSQEFAEMKTHTRIGNAIMGSHHTPLLKQAAEIALTHHERWDGKGYPEGLAGDDIPLAGRIVAVADVFDALTHDRPYKKAWPVEDAADEIQMQSGRQFDARVVTAFTVLIQRELEQEELENQSHALR
jgi:putative two-component system response regulator